MKKLFISLMVLGSTLMGTTAFAQEKITDIKAEQVQFLAPITDKLNINTATATEIQKVLIGIGAKKAEAIIQYREKHGAFTTADQLLEVQGIGKTTLDKNKDRIIF